MIDSTTEVKEPTQEEATPATAADVDFADDAGRARLAILIQHQGLGAFDRLAKGDETARQVRRLHCVTEFCQGDLRGAEQAVGLHVPVPIEQQCVAGGGRASPRRAAAIPIVSGGARRQPQRGGWQP